MPETHITEFDKDTLVVLPLRSLKENYLTLEKAIAHLIATDHLYYLEGMVRKNIPIRDAIRRHGAQAVADQLLQFAPDDDKLKTRLAEIVSSIEEYPIADFDIQVLPVTAEMEFFGKKITFDQLYRGAEISRRIGRWTSDFKSKDVPLHVAEIFEPYPCFDSFDAASETRSYSNYVIRDHPLTEADCLEIEESFSGRGVCFVNDSLSPKFLPIVYRDGDSDVMYVATAKPTSQVAPEEPTPQPTEPEQAPEEQHVSSEQSAPQIEPAPRPQKKSWILTLLAFFRKK